MTTTKTIKITNPVTDLIQKSLDNFDSNPTLSMQYLKEAEMILDGSLSETPARENTIGFNIPSNSIEWGTY